MIASYFQYFLTLSLLGVSAYLRWYKFLFFPQPSAVIRIKDSSYDFHPENSKHLLANIAPAPQARGTWQNGIAKGRDSLGTRCGTV